MKAASKTPLARPHRHRWHAPERGTTPAFLISLGAHTLLFIAIAFVVRWKTEPAGPVSAELWGGLPPVVQPAPPPPPPPTPPVKVEPAPQPEPVKPDIVLERKPEPKPEPKAEPKPEPKPEKKVEPVKKAEPDLKAEQRKRDEQEKIRKAEQAAAERQRQAAIERALASAGTPGPAPGGSVAGGGISDSYRGQIVSCIRPHIAFNVPDNLAARQHVAEFEVTLLPTGEQVGAPKLLRASGIGAYDQAVERAIRRCDPFPRPRDGAMPRSLRLTFDPVETR